MNWFIGSAAAALMLLSLAPSTSIARDVSAGPIWNNFDAQRKCPSVCGGRDRWDGNWRTIQTGRNSVCSCKGSFSDRRGTEPRGSDRRGKDRARSVNAGPIWNNFDAQKKCPSVCGSRDRWDGNWRTVSPGQSTCDCYR